MSYQVVGKAFGYRVGHFSKYQKRRYVYIDSGSIEFTDDVNESTLFTQLEVIDVFTRLMGKAAKQYFIIEDQVEIVQAVDLEKQDQ